MRDDMRLFFAQNTNLSIFFSFAIIACMVYAHRHSVAGCFLLVDGCLYSQSFCGFFIVVTVNIFLLVKKMMLTSLD